MKRVYAALMIIAVLMFCGHVERSSAFSAADITLAKVEEAEACIEKGELDDAVQRCGEINVIWSESRRILELFLPHNDLDAADLLAEKVVIYVREGDAENALIYIAELKSRLQSLKDSERIDIYNLL